MQEETLKVDLLANVKSKEMIDKDEFFLCLKSIKSFTEEKVGKDGLLELSIEFTDEIKDKIEENKFHYIEAQISKKMVLFF